MAEYAVVYSVQATGYQSSVQIEAASEDEAIAKYIAEHQHKCSIKLINGVNLAAFPVTPVVRVYADGTNDGEFPF